jgi:FAD synthase
VDLEKLGNYGMVRVRDDLDVDDNIRQALAEGNIEIYRVLLEEKSLLRGTITHRICSGAARRFGLACVDSFSLYMWVVCGVQQSFAFSTWC